MLTTPPLLAQATFPETAPNSQLARFLYYNGRIKALQLEYSDAHRCLLQATRKAPQTTGRKALGFRLAVRQLVGSASRPMSPPSGSKGSCRSI